MDPIECASRTTIDCPSAGKLMASIMERSAINVPYRQVFNFYNRSSCLEPDYDVSHVVGLYDDWAKAAEWHQIRTLYSVITEDPGCFFEYCKSLNFTGNADFAGVGVSQLSTHDQMFLSLVFWLTTETRSWSHCASRYPSPHASPSSTSISSLHGRMASGVLSEPRSTHSS